MKEGKGEREHTPGMVNQYIDHICLHLRKYPRKQSRTSKKKRKISIPANKNQLKEKIELKLVKRKGK
jgi:hypothetical protein